MKRYFSELSEMYDFVKEAGVKMISYNFTFAYGYELIYEEHEGGVYNASED